MSDLARVSISIEESLLRRFDRVSARRGYPTRSEAVKSLIREALLGEDCRIEGRGPVAGAITLAYDHHRSAVVGKLLHIQHEFADLIVSSQHVHLNAHHCLEVIAVRGRASALQRLLAALKAVKGLKHAGFLAAAAGED